MSEQDSDISPQDPNISPPSGSIERYLRIRNVAYAMWGGDRSPEVIEKTALAFDEIDRILAGLDDEDIEDDQDD